VTYPHGSRIFVNEGFSEVDEMIVIGKNGGKFENIFDDSVMKSGNVKDRII